MEGAREHFEARSIDSRVGDRCSDHPWHPCRRHHGMEQRSGRQDRPDGAAAYADVMTRARQHRQQRGQETLTAVLAVGFMLLPVLFGIVELGGLIHVWI